MEITLIDIVPWIYISLQLIITIAVSLLGVNYVRKEFKLQKERANQQSLQIQMQQPTKETTTTTISMNAEKKEEEPPKEREDNETDKNKKEIQSQLQMMSKMGFCQLWLKTVWKMRSVYGSFAVHIFDVLTDALVIIEWWNMEKGDNDIAHVNSRTMAICGITVLLFHKCISTIAFWAKEASISRCILQFLDLLIFEEIYVSHNKIVTQWRNQSNSKDGSEKEAVDTTTSFKFVRNLEAIFESIPQSILQLVFIMRTSAKYEGTDDMFIYISIISIIQSVVSMTNSILKNDNIQMNLPKWKKHKKRLPPTIPFLKHAIARLSEVIYRIGLFALFWTVCEGQAFSVLLAFELLLVFGLSIWDVFEDEDSLRFWQHLSIDDWCLRVQTIIVLPSELIYSWEVGGSHWFSGQFTLQEFKDRDTECIGTCLGCCCCFYTPAVILSTLCYHREDHFFHVNLRIGLSMMEWTVLILWAVLVDERFTYLFSINHGLYPFIICIVCFMIYSQYLYLFPQFSLPHHVSVRSRYGYAFNGELEELQRVKVPEFPYTVDKWSTVQNESEFWDIEHNREGTTCCMFALSNNQGHIVEWLTTEKGVTRHQKLQKKYAESMGSNLDETFARRFVDPNNEYFK